MKLIGWVLLEILVFWDVTPWCSVSRSPRLGLLYPGDEGTATHRNFANDTASQRRRSESCRNTADVANFRTPAVDAASVAGRNGTIYALRPLVMPVACACLPDNVLMNARASIVLLFVCLFRWSATHSTACFRQQTIAYRESRSRTTGCSILLDHNYGYGIA